MKSKVMLLICMTVFILCGCTEDSIDNEQMPESASLIENIENVSEDVFESEAEADSVSEPVEEIPALDLEGLDEDTVNYIQRWNKELTLIATDEELVQLEKIQWEENISPYMEYDWFGDANMEDFNFFENSWTMMLADINMDGQPEMLIGENAYNYEEGTYVYTVVQDEVVFCGKIRGGKDYVYKEDYQMIDFYPSNLIDVYQNNEGELRYISCHAFWMNPHGFCQYFSGTMIDNKISCEPIYAHQYWEDTEQNKHYGYIVGDYYEPKEKDETDENYTDFNILMGEYMNGYTKVDISFVTSEYCPPEVTKYLPEEYQEIVRINIKYGFAKALGYL